MDTFIHKNKIHKKTTTQALTKGAACEFTSTHTFLLGHGITLHALYMYRVYRGMFMQL